MMRRMHILFGMVAFAMFSVNAGSSLTSSGAGSDPCGITGKWKNELGSSVEFSCQNGLLYGRYKSAVGAASNYYDLSGRYTMSGPSGTDCILGFSVAWNNVARGNSNSTTSWTGIHYAAEDTIYTTWILTKYTAVADKWRNSYINQDKFSRCAIC